MAVTKTHPIKRALKAAIDYICNPEKTDGKLLVSAYGCAPPKLQISNFPGPAATPSTRERTWAAT